MALPLGTLPLLPLPGNMINPVLPWFVRSPVHLGWMTKNQKQSKKKKKKNLFPSKDVHPHVLLTTTTNAAFRPFVNDE